MAKAKSFLPRAPEAKAASPYHWVSAEFSESYPAIFDLLATAKIDGEDRQGATITVFADAGKLKASIHDRHTDQSLFVTLDSPLGLWEALERYVVANPDEWRQRKEQGNGRVRRT